MTDLHRRPGLPPIVQCPTCGTKVRFEPASVFRPFCSERCRLIDLGAWASETYAIPCEPGQTGTADDDDPGQDRS